MTEGLRSPVSRKRGSENITLDTVPPSLRGAPGRQMAGRLLGGIRSITRGESSEARRKTAYGLRIR